MEPPSAGAALTLEGVSKAFRSDGRRIQALDTVAFATAPGQVAGLIGPDSAGKTTLMRLAAALMQPDARFGLYEDLTVQENLDLYADLQGVPMEERPARYAELLRMVGLAPFVDRLARNLSGGMKQKLGLACTLVRRPRLLLLDEPTVGVDPVSRRELWAIVYRLVREEGASVLLSTAYLDEAERCDSVILLHQGRVLGQGTPAEFRAPLDGHSYLVEVPGVAKRRLQTRLAALPGVVDAVIQGEAVRVVTRVPAPPDLAALADVGGAPPAVRPVPPIFEDAFVSRLRRAPDAAGPVTAALPVVATAAGDGAAIVVDGVQRRFGDFYAVRDVSFEVRRGEVFGLLGANGAGKTTTFRMLCGLLPASAGRLRVAGYDLRHAAARARSRIGYMAQRFSLYVNLTVEQNLRFFASAYGLRRGTRRERIQWALEGFDLTPYAAMSSGDLALGFKQRLAMAAALMHEPDILFLDEPTSGVDPLARREFWQRINLLAEQGVTVLVTTHFMDEANYCDRLLVMADGHPLAQGTPSEMKARFRTAELPDPTMEDAFIGLMEQHAAAVAARA